MQADIAADAKSYVDCGVQTDLDFLTSSLTHVPSSNSNELCVCHSSSENTAQLSPLYHSRASTHFDSAYSYASDNPDPSESSPGPSITTIVRAYNDQLSYGRPSGSASKKIFPTRIISLPETVSSYSAKAILEKTAVRVVSMPLLDTENSESISDPAEAEAGCKRAFIYEPEGPRVRAKSHVSDMPYTPSPPSSPESIVIIANKDQLPEGFLRGTHAETGPLTRPEDEGWITWTKSPPRPIPALHGPLSLPYARCPSGAEGTIIEEQDNLSRMIWGLEGEDLPSSRVRSDSTLHQPSVQSRPPLHTAHANVPPRLQKSRFEPTTRYENIELARSSTREHQMQLTSLQPRAEVATYPLRGPEPIDLDELVRKQAEMSLGGHRDYNSSNNQAPIPVNYDAHFYSSRDDIGLDWQSTLLSPEGLKGSGLMSTIPLNHSLGTSLQSSVSDSSVHSLGYLGSSRSPIILDSPGQLTQLSRVCPPRRLSALEIAQQYRQQQLWMQQQKQQQQAFLPTPPSSSSPIWSSAFSPYQNSSFSPELRSAVGLPRLSPSLLQLPLVSHSDVTSHIQKSSRDRLGSYDILGRKIDVSSLAPAAQINGTSLDPLTNLNSDLASLTEYLQSRTRQRPTTVQTMRRAEHSPAQPKPPPNTPLGMMAARETGRIGNFSHSSDLTTPLSPTSPKPRPRSISHQQTRSIPLARLIQRRLSSVPEEDTSLVVDQSFSRAPGLSQLPRPRSRSSGGPSGNVHFLLSPPSPLPGEFRTSSPFGETLVPQNTFVGGDSGSQYQHATVKLPSAKASNHREGGNNAAQAGQKKGEQARRKEESKEGTHRGQDNARGKGPRRPPRGRRGRAEGSVRVNGPERVDGGLVVKS